MNEVNMDRKFYLQQFQRDNKPVESLSKKAPSIGTEIVDLMKKEDLTHDEAYASLQYAYNLIRYESNFLKLK
ncbi:hypothetical protein IWT140_02229 [Secundilactobacillus pentosiphilus]|uniref:Uncharacterized protein n=1 Tax=Secundilactobacillus pentosiphilus TaxID=1714682 RepID=A0A1Z5IS38_9LACO|nr:hypothetical protein [Secundilactobacillus pentosiphilus]GAX04587.1 hypothetical protein IWT140_02229 [Secundilactobacillus pentosiphilus]